MIGAIASALGAIARPVVNYLGKREERKGAAKVVEGKIALAKVEGHQSIELKRAEWENIAVESTKDSWKDEYVTLIITSPLLLIILGSVYAAFTGDTRLLDSATVALSTLAELGIDMGQMMLLVVLAAIGIRGARRLL